MQLMFKHTLDLCLNVAFEQNNPVLTILGRKGLVLDMLVRGSICMLLKCDESKVEVFPGFT